MRDCGRENHNLVKYLLVVIGLCGGAIAGYVFSRKESSLDYQNLSTTQLKKAGYYSYELSKTYKEEEGWSAILSMYGFDWHCEPSRDYKWNPVHISYVNKSGGYVEISISPLGNPFFDPSVPKTQIELPVDWIPSTNGEFYRTSSGSIRIRVIDFLMNEVVIVSDLHLHDLTKFITHLKYTGPNIKDVGNSWEKACKQSIPTESGK